MKSFILLAMMFLATEAFADVYVCHEIESKSATTKEVKVIMLENITDKVPYGDDFDSVTKVVVEIREIENGVRLLKRKFTAIQKSADVISQIETPDFRFIRFYDEEDQDGMSLKINGRFEEFRLHCTDME